MMTSASRNRPHVPLRRIAIVLMAMLVFGFSLWGSNLPAHAIAISEKPVTVADLEKPHGYVQDYAGILSDTSKGQLNALGKELQEKTGAQFVVVVLHSLNGSDIETLGLDIGRTWGVGEAKKNTGLVFLVAVDDHKMRAEIGYGLEGIIPDGLSGEVQRQVIRPYFKANDYENGIKAGMFQYASLIAKEHNVTLTPIEGLAPIQFDTHGRDIPEKDIDTMFFLAIVVIFILLSIFGRKGRGNGSNSGSGPFFFGGFGDSGGGFGGGDSFGGFGGGSFGGGGSSSDW